MGHEALLPALSAAVPLRVLELERKGGPDEADFARVRGDAELVASGSDGMLFRGNERGHAAKLFNALADARAGSGSPASAGPPARTTTRRAADMSVTETDYCPLGRHEPTGGVRFPTDPNAPAPPGVTLTLAMAEVLVDLATVVAPMRPASMTPREWREWNRVLGLIEDAVRVAKGGGA